MSDCSKHKKEVAGISDMKELAEMIGDLHYETLVELLIHFKNKLRIDAVKDYGEGRNNLGNALNNLSNRIYDASVAANRVWQISKPFMQENNQP